MIRSVVCLGVLGLASFVMIGCGDSSVPNNKPVANDNIPKATEEQKADLQAKAKAHNEGMGKMMKGGNISSKKDEIMKKFGEQKMGKQKSEKE